MGRPKGGKNRYYTQQDKLKYVKRILNGESANQIGRDENMSNGMLLSWVKKYSEGGAAALIPKRKPGNPLSKFQNKKNLTDLEKLQFENMKLRIENLRLKKGYTNEEAVSAKQRKLFKKNTK